MEMTSSITLVSRVPFLIVAPYSFKFRTTQNFRRRQRRNLLTTHRALITPRRLIRTNRAVRLASTRSASRAQSHSSVERTIPEASGRSPIRVGSTISSRDPKILGVQRHFENNGKRMVGSCKLRRTENQVSSNGSSLWQMSRESALWNSVCQSSQSEQKCEMACVRPCVVEATPMSS